MWEGAGLAKRGGREGGDRVWRDRNEQEKDGKVMERRGRVRHRKQRRVI